MPGKATGRARRAAAPRRPRRFRRATDDEVRAAARRVLMRPAPSQGALRRALVRELRRDEPLAAISGPRVRRLLALDTRFRVEVSYSERLADRPLVACPVCGSALRPIRNATLDGSAVELGQRCSRCAFWTHRKRRVPIRYAFRRGR